MSPKLVRWWFLGAMAGIYFNRYITESATVFWAFALASIAITIVEEGESL